MPTKTDLRCPVCAQHVSSCTCSNEAIWKWAAGSGRSIGEKFEAREYIDERALFQNEILWGARVERGGGYGGFGGGGERRVGWKGQTD